MGKWSKNFLRLGSKSLIPLFMLINLGGTLFGGGKIYWSDFSTKKIQSANLDGNGVTDLVSGLTYPKGDLAIDLQNNKLYWIDSGS